MLGRLKFPGQTKVSRWSPDKKSVFPVKKAKKMADLSTRRRFFLCFVFNPNPIEKHAKTAEIEALEVDHPREKSNFWAD